MRYKDMLPCTACANKCLCMQWAVMEFLSVVLQNLNNPNDIAGTSDSSHLFHKFICILSKHANISPWCSEIQTWPHLQAKHILEDGKLSRRYKVLGARAWELGEHTAVGWHRGSCNFYTHSCWAGIRVDANLLQWSTSVSELAQVCLISTRLSLFTFPRASA